MPAPVPRPELLGKVTVPSGVVLIVDAGLLNLWTHDKAPLLPEGVLSDEAAASAKAAEDFRIEGPDAEVAGKAFGRQWHPLFAYDIPGSGVAAFKEMFAAFARSKGYRAQLVLQHPRVPHRERLSRAVDFGNGAGVVEFHGISAVAVGNLPRSQELRVVAERMGEGAFPDHWRFVGLELRPADRIHESLIVGSVAVDWARLMFIDVEALGSWTHDEPVDGKADFVFWGRDAEAVAATTNANRLSDSEFGWTDLAVAIAAERGMEVERLRQSRQLRFATDFRPHSDHFHLLAQMRASATESGTVSIGGAQACGFFTQWGDGFFPVWLDLDERRAVVRIRIELGTTDAIRNLRAVNGLPPE